MYLKEVLVENKGDVLKGALGFTGTAAGVGMMWLSHYNSKNVEANIIADQARMPGDKHYSWREKFSKRLPTYLLGICGLALTVASPFLAGYNLGDARDKIDGIGRD